jgi:penicillin-binding protein 2
VKGISSSREPAFGRRRFSLFFVAASLCMLVLIGRLYLLQIVKGEEYTRRSESNFVQARRIAHNRGIVFDQSGEVLVDNRPSHDLYMTLAFLPDSMVGVRRLAEPLGLDAEGRKALDKAILRGVEQRETIVAGDDLAPGVCRRLRARVLRYDIDGVHVVGDPVDEDARCSVLVETSRFPSRAAVFRRVQELLRLPDDLMQAAIASAMRKARGLGKFKPALLLQDIGFDAYARIEAAASLGELPGIDVVDSKKRRYRRGISAAHLLGFTNELSGEELKERKEQGYRLGDRIGRRGVEASYESVLRGQDGVQRVVVDAKGRRMDTPWARDLIGPDGRDPPQAGHSLVLSIDHHLQEAAEKWFLGKAGSVVALDVKSGFVLAMASFPPYDPNEVTGRESARVWRTLTSDKLRPLRNKAIQDHYAPGSTFKAITGLAGLREHVVAEHDHRYCPGYFRLGRARWRCYNRGGHGNIALGEALKRSCDTYFYSLGYDLGPDRLADTARLMGFGSPTGLGLDREIPGIMPDKAWYEKRLGYYTPGLVVNSSIGQGDVTVTPLQLAVAYATIANGGERYRPQVVREVRDADGELVEAFSPDLLAVVDIEPELIALVRESLAYVTHPGGTAVGVHWRRDMPEMSQWLRESGIHIAGKTGTAQVVRLSKSVAHVDPEDVAYEQRDHAWFVGFAPPDDPEIVVVTMTEHGGFGGSMSAPVTAQVIKAWFDHVRGHGRYAGLGPPPLRPVVKWLPKKAKEPPPPEEGGGEEPVAADGAGGGSGGN